MGSKVSTNSDLKRLQKKFSAKELDILRAIYSDLCQRCQTPGLTKCIDKDLFREVFKIPGPLSDCIFHVFDKQNRGWIDYEEFIAGLAILCRGDCDEKMDFLFNMYDLTGAGTVSRKHLSIVLHTMLHAAYAIVCHHSDDRRCKEDVTDRICSKVEAFVSSAFEDNSRDYIGKQEFVQWAKAKLPSVDLVGFLFKECTTPSNRASQSLSPTGEALTFSDVIRSSPATRSSSPSRGGCTYSSYCCRIPQLKCQSVQSTAFSGADTSFEADEEVELSDYQHILEYVYDNDRPGFQYRCPKCHELIEVSHCIECGTTLLTYGSKRLACDDCWRQGHDTVLIYCYSCGVRIE